MARDWTFVQKVGGSFAILVGLATLVGVVAIFALRAVVSAKDRVIDVEAQVLIDGERLHAMSESKGSTSRGFLLVRDEHLLTAMQDARRELAAVLERLHRNVTSGELRSLVDAIRQAESAHQRALDDVIALRRTDAALDVVARAFDERVSVPRQQLDAAVEAFVSRQTQHLESAKQASS